METRQYAHPPVVITTTTTTTTTIQRGGSCGPQLISNSADVSTAHTAHHNAAVQPIIQSLTICTDFHTQSGANVGTCTSTIAAAPTVFGQLHPSVSSLAASNQIPVYQMSSHQYRELIAKQHADTRMNRAGKLSEMLQEVLQSVNYINAQYVAHHADNQVSAHVFILLFAHERVIICVCL